MTKTKRQLEKFKIELHDFEMVLIEDALEGAISRLPEECERAQSIKKIIKKLYSEAYN